MEEEKVISFVTNFKHWDLVYSSRQKTPDEIYEKIELKSQIMLALSQLKEKERRVLIMRFGLEDGDERTLVEVARQLKLSPTRIRQLEAIALRKLKHPASRLRMQRIVDSYQEEVKVEDYEKIAELPVDLNIVLISTNVYENLIHHFARNPEKMKTLDPRKFEEIIAELFFGFGYHVELTKQTRDGGRDIIAIKDSEVLAKYIIEAKRPDPETPVRIGPVRELYGVKSDEGATKAILATTTYFTRDARIFFDRHKWELEPRDFQGIMKWIHDYLKIREKK
jgi:HJR/Mrr/RecB family endonuclease/DNA-binding CsgD family transcriptional regulator